MRLPWLSLCIFSILTSVNSIAHSARLIKLTPTITAEEHILSNGLTVYLIPNKRAPLTSVYHWVKAGSVNEKPGVTGIAHLFEHMMFRPLKKGDSNFFDSLRAISGDANANTRFTSTVFLSSVPHENLEKLLELESARFKNLKVDEELLAVERKAVWSEYSTKFDSNPMLDLWYSIYHAGFPGHPYGWTIVGEREDLEKIKASDCNEFFQKFYVPNNVGLFIAGDFDPKKVLPVVEKLYGGWISGTASTPPPAFSGKAGMIRSEGKLTSGVKNILVGYRIPLHDGKNILQINLTNHILFGSQFSLADRRFVHSKKMASNASEFNSDYDSGMIKGLISLLPTTTVDSAVKELPELLKDLKDIPNAEFNAYVKEYQTHIRESALRNEELNELAALSWGKWTSIDQVANILNKPIKITKKEIIDFAQSILNNDNLIVVSSKGAQ